MGSAINFDFGEPCQSLFVLIVVHSRFHFNRENTELPCTYGKECMTIN